MKASDLEMGQKILPREELIAFFENQKGNPVYKVPVVLHYGSRFPGALDEAYIAVSEDMDQADKVFLAPDDSGLGIGMADRIRGLFGDQKVCHVWLIGKWGTLLGDGTSGKQKKGTYPFTVHDILKRTDGPTENTEARILKP